MSSWGKFKPPTSAEFRVIGTALLLALLAGGCYRFSQSFADGVEPALAAQSRWVGAGLMAAAWLMRFDWLVAAFNWLSWKYTERQWQKESDGDDQATP
ncbi:MAG: hypothetical protein QGG36_04255 [Pirellulaceae bacterium]|jgi:hypothetical protein|nr:hypothetical protein [Pirellulaceae bacterium]MDP7014982.1 hypothetical protein [Pirellulaceae bacterium]